MKGAGFIYLLSGLVLLGTDLFGSFSKGVSLGTLFFAIFAAGFFMLARGLFRDRSNARRYAIIGSGALVVCFTYIALSSLLPLGPLSFSEVFEIVWPVFAVAAVAAVAHVIAFALLVFWPARPNYSVRDFSSSPTN